MLICHIYILWQNTLLEHCFVGYNFAARSASWLMKKCCACVTHFSVYNVNNIVRTRRALHNSPISSLRPRQNGRHFADAILKCISLIENVGIPIKISPKFVPTGPINNFPALVQIMAWRRSGDKPLSEPMAVSLPTHICVTPPQWVKVSYCEFNPT